MNKVSISIRKCSLKMKLLLGFIILPISVDVLSQTFIEPFRILEPEIIDRYKNLYEDRDSGASYDPATGAVTFAVTDVAIPGNSSLPVELSRWVPADDLETGGFGKGSAWQWDIPVIKANHMGMNPHQSGEGTVTIEPGGWRSGKNCSESYSPNVHVAVPIAGHNSHNVRPWFYWEGKQLHIPGKTTEKFLDATQTDGSVKQVTKSNYYVESCVPLANGQEGFLVKGPDGTTYTFGHIVSYYTGAAPPTQRSPLTTFTKLILVTNIEDRFGNTVEYNYNSVGDLSSIVSSDGRRIDVFYKTYSFKGTINHIVDYVEANDKVWTYHYSDWQPDLASAEKRKYLSKVELPDGSAWKYPLNLRKLSFNPINNRLVSNFHPTTGENLAGLCEAASVSNSNSTNAPFSVTVTNPDGVISTYSFAAIYHGRSNVSPEPVVTHTWAQNVNVTVTTVRARNLNCSVSMSLVKKTISGGGIGSQEWQYTYSQNSGTYSTTSYHQPGSPQLSFINGVPDNIVDTKDYRSTQVVGPDSKVVYYIDRRFQSPTEGSVVAEDHLNKSTNSLLKRIEKTYVKGNFVGDFWYVDDPADFDGPTRNSLNGNLLQYRVNTTNIRTKLYHSDGTDIYDLAYTDYDSWGFAEKTIESNQFSTKSRYTKQGYLHDETNWILGLPTTTQVSASDSGYTTITEIVYHSDANTGDYIDLYLPYEYKSYGTWVRRYPEYHSSGQLKKIEYNQPLRKADGSLDTNKNRYQLLTNYKRGKAQNIQTAQRYSDTATMSFSRTVNDDGLTTSITDLNGVTVYYDYDQVGRLKSVDLPSGWLDTFVEWEEVANTPIKRIGRSCTLNTDRSGCMDGSVALESTNEYDALYRILLSHDKDVTNNLNRYQNFDFNSIHLPTFSSFKSTSSTESDGTSSSYDDLGRLTSTTLSGGGTVTTAYLAGNKIRVTDAEGNQTTTTYLAYGAPEYSQALTISSPENITTTQVINVFGDITSVTQSGPGKDGNGTLSQTEYRAYDARHHLCKISRNDVGTTVFSNSVLGEVQWQAQGVGGGAVTNCTSNATAANQVVMQYDNQGAVWKVNYPDGGNHPAADLTYTRDNNGNVQTLVAGSVTQTYNYNILGLLEDETLQVNGEAFVLDYGYNAAGHLSSLKYPDGDQVNFSPNSFGEARQAVRQARTGRTAFSYASNVSYYPSGMIDTFTYGNNLTHKTTLNSKKMPERIQDYRSGFNALDYSYTYDDNLQVTSLTDNVISSFSITDMAYDGLGRLTSTTGNFGIGSSTMRYDGLGNITYYKNKKHTLDYAYDTSNRLEFILGSKPYDSFTYDSRGSVTNNSHHAFTYNLANQMVTSGSNGYTYDGHNRRVIAQEGTKTNYSFYSQSGQLLYTETAHGGVNYIYLGKKLIAKDGVVPHSSAKQHYLPYGGSVEGEKNDVGYTGHKFDTALNLSYMQARYYDPVIGRFYSNDPVGFTDRDVSTFNRFGYVGNDPYNYTDPSGEARHKGDKGGVAAAYLIAKGVAAVTEPGSAANTYANKVAEVSQKAMTDKGVKIKIKIDKNWSEDQKAQAKSKVETLNKAAKDGELTVTKKPERAATSAKRRYESENGKGSAGEGNDVDHTKDLQLGGTDTVDNMAPLDKSVNRSLGAQIQHQIKDLPAGTKVCSVEVCN